MYELPACEFVEVVSNRAVLLAVNSFKGSTCSYRLPAGGAIQYSEYHQERSLTEQRKPGNVLFNDTLNTFYLRLYGVIHMVKDDSDCEGGNPLPPHGLLFPISSNGFFYMYHSTDRITHTTVFVTPVVEH